MFWDHVYRNRHIMQEFEDIEVHKTSVSVFVALFYLEMLYILIMTLSILNSYEKMIHPKPVERLFLQKSDGQTIYVDLQKPHPQHQIDGIRFLYKQYKMKTPGVILNDPSGYGKCLQVVLFLNALRPSLKKPVLILSNTVDNWKEHFERWTDCSDHIAIAPSNPFSKHQIIINPIKDGLSFSRRAWGIVVLHDEYCTKDLLSLKFNADYKIWVTSEDLKENLHTLSLIYEWLYPNQTFNAYDFTADPSNWRDVVEKALLLDSFLEDFLIRRTDFSIPFRKPEKHKPSLPATSPVKATLKNKDPTGTKVKRSKRRKIEDDDDNIINSNETAPKNTSNEEAIKNVSDNNMDVESFIRNEKPVDSEGFNFIQNESTDIVVTMKIPESMDIDFIKIGDDKQPKRASHNTDVNSEHILDKSVNDKGESNKIGNSIKDLEDTQILDNNSQNLLQERVLQNTEVDSENILNEAYKQETTQHIAKSVNDFEDTQILNNNSPNLLQEKEPRNTDVDSENILDEAYKQENNQHIKKSINNLEDTQILKNNPPNILQDTEIITQGDETNELIKNAKETNRITILAAATEDSTEESQNDKKMSKPGIIVPETENSNSTEIGIVKEKPHSINGDKSKENNEADDNTNLNKTNKVTKQSIMDEIDAQLAEYQEKALKKYGSILDTLF